MLLAGYGDYLRRERALVPSTVAAYVLRARAVHRWEWPRRGPDEFPKSANLIKRDVGAEDLIKDVERYCLWMKRAIACRATTDKRIDSPYVLPLTYSVGPALVSCVASDTRTTRASIQRADPQ